MKECQQVMSKPFIPVCLSGFLQQCEHIIIGNFTVSPPDQAPVECRRLMVCINLQNSFQQNVLGTPPP